VKKNFWLVFVLVAMVFVGSGFCAETSNDSFIVITSPKSGANWVKDTNKNITWDKIGIQDAFVRIQLLKGRSMVLDIVSSTENDGAYEWKIPKAIKNGVYFIHIATLDKKVKSMNNIVIVDGIIWVTQPESGATWVNGTIQDIVWVSEGKVHNKARIELYDGITKVLDIAKKIPTAIGRFAWKIPITLPPSSAYSIRIVTKGDMARSGMFSLPNGKVPAIKPSLEIEVWKGIWTILPVLKKIENNPWEKGNEQNQGVSLRYKPRKSFSIGLSYQQIKVRYFYSQSWLIPDYWSEWDNNLKYWRHLDAYREKRENANISSNIALFDLRWDIKSNWRIHPYFTFGLGAAFLNIVDDYYDSEKYTDSKDPSYKPVISDRERTEGGLFDFDIPILPVLELMFGLKIELLKKHLAIGVEGGLINGIVCRGTLNIRI
jgi:hypothetical protein